MDDTKNESRPVVSDETLPGNTGETADHETSHTHRPWLAGLLSLLCPGLGQFYNMAPRRALCIFALFAVLIAALLIVLSIPPVAGSTVILFFVLGCAAMLLMVFSAIDAVRGARRGGIAIPGKFNSVYVLGGILLVFFLLAQQSYSRSGFGPIWDTVHVADWSMAPALRSGDYVIGWKSAWTDRRPERGALILFSEAGREKPLYASRIVGLPGDRIQMREGRLFINGVITERKEDGTFSYDRDGKKITVPQYTEIFAPGGPHTVLEISDKERLDNTTAYAVPADYYLVMGDNRDESLDSLLQQRFGFVPATSLRGAPTIIFWSRDKSRIGINFQ